jgi:hypothetical protein
MKMITYQHRVLRSRTPGLLKPLLHTPSWHNA